MSSVPARLPAAVVFDLDGTLYRQPPLRRRMLGELARAPFRLGPREALSVVRALRAFRSAREELRELGRPEESLEELQYRIPARRLRVEPERVRAIVEEWMFRRPLPHLAPCRRPGLVELLDELRGRGVELGVFSDYAPDEKLAALGVREYFAVRLCAVDAEINAFKPHPRGFRFACERLALEPVQVLYVGDRADVDSAGAAAAGMECVLVEDGAESDYGEVWRVLER